jgi:hypothetical protein
MSVQVIRVPGGCCEEECGGKKKECCKKREERVGCETLESLSRKVRRLEADSIIQQLGYRIVNSLDLMLDAPSPQSEQFVTNINWVLSQFLIPGFHVNINNRFFFSNPEEFRAGWSVLNSIFQYRRRVLCNETTTEYYDPITCLRTIRYTNIAISLGILNPVPPSTEPQDVLTLDRVNVLWREVSPGVFKLVDLVQFEEARFPLSPPYRAHQRRERILCEQKIYFSAHLRSCGRFLRFCSPSNGLSHYRKIKNPSD